MNPYQLFVSAFAKLLREGKSLPLGNIPAADRSIPKPNAPVALIFSPHPDDECIIGGLALRLLREAGLRVINVAVTLGSNPARRPARWQELKKACDWIGFELEAAAANGLEKINPRTRIEAPTVWAEVVKFVAASLQRNQPRVIFVPHEHDWNSTHIGTHLLVMDALRSLPVEFSCLLVETEFWGQMTAPNLMVESSVEDLSAMLTALSFHVGEVQRNPYHLRLPGWMQDNVRRGSELVGGQGGVAPDIAFATLYRARQWKDGQVADAYSGGRQLDAVQSASVLLEWLNR
jgi:LmbE family N-acetylglucosaminyl deacetylase